MNSYFLSDKELRKESRKLINSLSKRISNIEVLGDSAPQYAVNNFRRLQETIPKSLDKLKGKELRNLYRDLRYINSLKSSTVKGAKEVQKTFEPIKEKLDVLSPQLKDKFWEIYEKFYDIAGGTAEHFKYELFDANIDFIYSGNDTEKIVHDIIEEYNKSYKELGEFATDENVKILFSSKLNELRKKY